ncbi:hypothetical protein JKF63_05340 [Porcisia hertigi]|uniref:Uncharacterized protein n=1 Tax=Porcisia hertigi TaxID=2761500 RepID=A0A836LIS8_9TRYP|nr:hypothetical protein JKF63_05340 [Porcisia hertigi]
MSYDTNLHRTFDYQLSSASLRIIDWAPSRAVARSALQTGQGAKAFTLVNDATSNLPSVATAYVQQEKQQHMHRNRGSSISPTTAAATTDAAPLGESPFVTEASATSEPPNLSAVPPYYAAGMSSSAAATAANCGSGGQTELHVPQLDDSQPQRQLSDTWGVTTGEPIGGKATGNAAATSGVLMHTQASPTDTTDVGGVPQAAPVVSGNGNSAQRVGAATSAAVTDGVQWSRESLAPPTASSRLTKDVSRYGTAGIMYGFDSVYHKASFGVLVGLFTGVGYNQINTFYRQEQSASPRHSEPPKSEHKSGARGATTTTQRASPDTIAAGVPTSQSGTTTNLETSGAPPGPGPSGALDTAVEDDAVELRRTESTAPHRLSALNPWREPVIASQRHGELKMYNALQLFWYWGARRWTGVLNVRLTPLPSGDALLPVCEYVTRTVMTECSIVVDDPVVYLHGFVVMLGRRTRAAEESRTLHGTVASGSGTGVQIGNGLNQTTLSQDQTGWTHPLEAAASASLMSKAADLTTATSATTGTTHTPQVITVGFPVSLSPGGPEAGVQSATRSSIDGTPTATTGSTAPSRTSFFPPVTSSAEHPHRYPPEAKTAVDRSESNSAALWKPPCDAAMPSGTAAADKSDAAPLREWIYWYQRCVLETTDEWLWNRAALEVAEEAARSATPWWKPRHIKMGVGLSFRYRKPRGVNVYWGWSARVGRSLHFSGHVDVLRRMSCAVSSAFGFLDVSVRLRVNLVTLHQTALDAGVCWRPLPQVPDLAVRLATSANGTTLGLEIADLAPTLYGPVVARLSDRRSRRHRSKPTEPPTHMVGCGEADVTAAVLGAKRLPHSGDQSCVSSGAGLGMMDSSREDLVGLLPVTWHYLQQAGSTITSVFSGAKGALMSTLSFVSCASSDVGPISSTRSSDSVPILRRPPVQLSVNPTPTTPATLSTLPVGQELSRLALPAGQASLRYAKSAWHALTDLGWLENALRTSHVNVSMGVTSEPSNRHREWSLFLIITEK